MSTTPQNRQQLKQLVTQKFLDNVIEAIRPEDARNVLNAIIDSSGLLQEEMAAKADLVNGKVPTSQLPVPAAQLASIPAWSTATPYIIGRQVTYQNQIWESRVNNNQNIPPTEGQVWREVSPTHIQNTDTQLLTATGTPVTAQYILDQLASKISTALINQPGGVVGLNQAGQLARSVLQALLDDLATTGSNATWSINRIKSYITEQLSSVTSVNRPPVASISARNALQTSANPPLQDGESVWVSNATGDPTVGSGWAIYRWFASNSSWSKVMEQEGLDMQVNVNPSLGGELSGTASNAVISTAAVMAKLLVGLGSVAGELLSTDNIILGFSKIKHFIANIEARVLATIAAGLDVNLPGEPGATDSLIQILGKLTNKVNTHSQSMDRITAGTMVTLAPITAVAQTRTLDLGTRQHTSFKLLDVNQAFALAFSSLAEDRFFTLTMIKTVVADVNITVPSNSRGGGNMDIVANGNIIILTGTANSIHVLAGHVFSDGTSLIVKFDKQQSYT